MFTPFHPIVVFYMETTYCAKKVPDIYKKCNPRVKYIKLIFLEGVVYYKYYARNREN